MTMATGLATLALLALAACSSSSSDGTISSPTTTTAAPSASATPSVDPSTKGAIALQGDWHDTAAQWTVHFHEDGTFVEDYRGVVDFRVGKYAVNGKTVSLIGDDGNTDKGTVTGATLVFRLGTLSRM